MTIYNTKNTEITTLHRCHKLGTIGEEVTGVDDIKQCYAVIFSTQKGSVVHNPNLGWDIMQYMSMPLDAAATKMRTDLMRELNYQEQRAEVTDISFSYNSGLSGKLTAVIEFEYNGENEVAEVEA